MTTKDKKRVAIVTGGARGIGLGIAMALARENFDLAICGVRGLADVESALAELQKLGADTLYVRADVSDSSARENLVETTQKHFARLHVLVNNAGIAPKVRADLLEATEESFESVLKVNLQGPYFLTQQCARWMVEQKKADANWRGCIVNISSVSATLASSQSRGVLHIQGRSCDGDATLGRAPW